MDRIIEILLNAIPFTKFFEMFGMSKEICAFLAVLSVALTAWVLKIVIQKFINHYKNSKTAKDLEVPFDYNKIKSARELFIPTQFQNQSPTREDEPQFSHKYIAKELLIPFFIKTAFNEKKENDKFYLVLADSGMGKTTFMINLYLKYISFFNFRRKYEIRLFAFGDSQLLDKIDRIEKKEVPKTILLLDAFDEDTKLINPDKQDGLTDDERFRKRLDEIIEVVQGFKEVVITSRTQYFPGQEDKPYELKIPRFDERGFHTLAKMYLSPFSVKEIKKYINKKYGRLKFWNWKKKVKANAIVINSPKLMVRPMLLSYIDYFVESRYKFENTSQIYETLVAKWIDREATKRKYKTEDREQFKENLYN